MKKNHFIARKGLFSLALAAVGAMFLGSCAVDGFDDKEKFDDGVSGAKLESPELSTKTVTASDGSEKSCKYHGKVVYGAGGYECKAYNVDNPDNPEEVASDTIDGTSFQFKIAKIPIIRLRYVPWENEAKNNTEADKATVLSYSTLVPATTMPQSSDISDFIAEKLQDSDNEQAFELEAGGY